MMTGLFILGGFGMFLKLVVLLALVAMYLYAVVAPHKDRLDAKHRAWFDRADSILGAASRALGNSMKPYKIGEGLFLNMGQFFLFCIIAFIALAMMMGL